MYSLPPGDRVAMLTPNTAQYVVSQWAVWMAGGVAVPLCRAHPPSSHQYYLQVRLCSLHHEHFPEQYDNRTAGPSSSS